MDKRFLYPIIIPPRSRNIGRRTSEAQIQGLRNGVITATEAMSIRPMERTVTAIEIGAPQLTAPANKQIPNPKS